MRILHTADWHLGDKLGFINRTDDLRRALGRIADYCESKKIDVLLVAGDLFSELARIEALREAIEHWQIVFGQFLARGGTMLAITGNHDNVNYCESLTSAMALAAPMVGMQGQLVPGGRVYLATEPAFFRLKDHVHNNEVQFILMPYPTPAQYFQGDSKVVLASDKNRLLSEGFVKKLEEIAAKPSFDAKLPTVLMAHVNVSGISVGSQLFRITPEHDVIIPASAFTDRYDYVALGHIHKPQEILRSTIRYAGSIETMDAGERDDKKSVVYFELGPDGVIGEVDLLPMPSTPLFDIQITNPKEDIPRLQREIKDAKNALVKFNVVYKADTDQLESVLSQLQDMFPRCYARDWSEVNALGDTLTVEEPDRNKSFHDTVLDYLQSELSTHETTERDAIVEIAKKLMEELDRTEVAL